MLPSIISRRLGLPQTFRRNISQAKKYRRPAPGTSERPPPKYGDPLIASDRATVTPLEDNLTFIHRPPPTAPTPFSLTTNPASPLLRPKEPAPETGELYPPLVRPSAHQHSDQLVSDDIIRKIKFLRAQDPNKYTRGNLAKRFSVTQHFVGRVAALKKPERERRIELRNVQHEKNKEKWSERHSLVKAIRAKRREFW